MFCSIFSIDDQHKNDAFLENVVATNSMVPVSLTINDCLFPIIHRKCTHVSVERDILHFVCCLFVGLFFVGGVNQVQLPTGDPL